MRYAHIVGWGKYAPERVLTNQELEVMVETSDEWIRTRTGIRERRIATATKDTTATIAVRAAWDALRVANVSPHEIDLIIVATATPEYIFPSTACIVQDALGADRAGAYDLSAACSGFVYALSQARNAIVSGSADTALVIGSDTLSYFTDWQDRNTCVLFGDGAGAVVLQASEKPGGVLSSVLGSDGSGAELLMIPAGGSRIPATAQTVEQKQHYIKMDGKGVYRFAVRVMAKAAQDAVRRAGLAMDDVRLIIPHQANYRIIETAMQALRLPMSRAYVNLDRYGNTSAASIPIALCEAVEQNVVRPQDNVVLVGFGGGLTWAAAAIQWTGPRPVGILPFRYRLRDVFLHPWASIRSLWLRLRRRMMAAIPGTTRDIYQNGHKEEPRASSAAPTHLPPSEPPSNGHSNGHTPGDSGTGAPPPVNPPSEN